MRFPREVLLFVAVSSGAAAFVAGPPRPHSKQALHGVTMAHQHRFVDPYSPSSVTSSVLRFMAASDDEDDDIEDEDDDLTEPLAKGVDSVSWLPSVVGATAPSTPSPVDSQVLPLFPLGGIVYTPNSEHVLNIFEPRYRQMYNDILMNGTKRFVVSMSHPTQPGRFAQTGVLFELKDLKEVSEQTGDNIKYICNHKVTGRVRLHRILNPEAWTTRDTYLRVEGTIMKDNDDDDSQAKEKDDGDQKAGSSSNDVYGAIVAALPGSPREEKALCDAFARLVNIQHDVEEDVRFTRASAPTLAVKPGAGKDGLWQTIRLWQNFADQRLLARQNEVQRDFQDKLMAFLKKERGLKDGELPSVIGFEDLSPALQKEVGELQKRMALELKPLILESTLTMQKILEAEDHTARLQLVRYFVQGETRRLETKKALQGMFKSTASSTALSVGGDDKGGSTIPPEEQVTDVQKQAEKLKKTMDKSRSSLFTDEPDAFQ